MICLNCQSCFVPTHHIVNIQSTNSSEMAASVAGVFLPELQEKILESKILVVGAGGIGCEVLKNLVMTGFADIEIVSGHRVFRNRTFSSHNSSLSSSID